ncbi:flagella [Thermococcus litoralis DSM 5473]|uniref:Flagella n=1 Tax=Thermococcus litoralis (strain ATCC 51850 / DSM 5473 / JCM 8560 / NS-C) TaxID=523849 RepID=H3ZRC2_THELN|nr:hypothetical protein [Thermococcus litoralis]EHR77506.1 flagella [Thermococcus litoralis DSM 5473]
MGFSVSASTAILFTSILLIVSNLYLAWENSYVQVKDAERYWYDLKISRLSTKLNLASHSYAIGSDHYNLTLTIENNGNTVNVDYWSGIYDGNYVTLFNVADDNIGFLSSSEYLLPSESTSLNITFIPLTTSQHTLWIFVGNGCGLGVKWHYNGSAVLIDTTSWVCPSEVT